MDVIALSRIQFAVTVMFHFLFVPLSLGLGLMLVLAQRRAYRSGSPEDELAARFWLRLFAATFAVGVATGITMEFAFGTNWAAYSRFVGDIFGAPLAAEGLFAFFLESTFLGVLLFGREKVSRKAYYASAWLVFLGSHLSALWIIIANSWQQTPAGFVVRDGRAVLTDFFAAAFNPSALPRFFHTVASTWVMGGFMVTAIAAYYLVRGEHLVFARQALRIGLTIALIMSIAMPMLGHWHAVQVAETQPVKVAAFEGLAKTTADAPMSLFGYIDTATGESKGLKVPGMLSLLIGFDTKTRVTGLDSVPRADWPPLQATFQTYHLMVALGMLMVLIALVGLYLERAGRIERAGWFLKALRLTPILPMLAIQSGWAAAEIGRQPWIVTGQLRTADAVSAVVPAGQVLATLLVFIALYTLLYVGWARIMLKAIRRGPVADEPKPAAVAPAVRA